MPLIALVCAMTMFSGVAFADCDGDETVDETSSDAIFNIDYIASAMVDEGQDFYEEVYEGINDAIDDGDDVEADEEQGDLSYSDGEYVDANVDGAWISAADFMYNGVHYDSSGYSYTYYSENVLPGGGLDIPGRHVNDEGYVVDCDENLCLASDDLPYGTVVNVPFGTGTAVVYDCGGGYGNLDVYVSW